MKNIRAVAISAVIFLAIAIGVISLLNKPSPQEAAAKPKFAAESSEAPANTRRLRASAPPKMPKIIVSSPSTPADERRRAVVMKYLAETEPEKRRYIVPELVDLNDPQSIFQILELLKTETDPQVRDNLIAFLGYMPYSTNYAEEIIAAAREIHANPADPSDRLALQHMAIELQHPASAKFLRDVYDGANTLPEERINAGEGIIRLWREVGIGSAEESQQILQQMRLDTQAMADATERTQAYRALSVTRYDNREYFKQQLQIETDPDARNVLSAYAMADVKPTPTRGPTRTPWPSPTPWTNETPAPTQTPDGTVAPYVEPTPQIPQETPATAPAQITPTT